MLNLVIDFLEITQLETGESKMYRAQVNLRDIVEHSVFNFSKAQQEKSIQRENRFSRTSAVVYRSRPH